MNITLSFIDLGNQLPDGMRTAIVRFDMQNSTDLVESVGFTKLISRACMDMEGYTGGEIGLQLEPWVGQEPIDLPPGKKISLRLTVHVRHTVELEVEMLIDGRPYGGKYILEFGKGELQFPINPI